MEWGRGVTALGTTTIQKEKARFGIKDADRSRHLCVLGKKGSGRAEVLANIVLQDFERGEGVIIIDATGELTRTVVDRLPQEKLEKVILLDPSDAEHPFSFNLLEDIFLLPKGEGKSLFFEVCASVYSKKREYPLLSFFLPLLFEKKDTSLASLSFAVSSDEFRSRFFSESEIKEIEKFLKENAEIVDEFSDSAKYIGQDTLIRNLLGQPKGTLNARDALKDGALIILDCSKIHMFPTRMTPLVRLFSYTALVTGAHGTPVSLFLHECVRYLSEEERDRLFANEKMRIAVADSSSGEYAEHREKTLSRCGSALALSSSPIDRPLIERAFYPYISAEEVEAFKTGEMVVALTIDSVRARPFFARALPLPGKTYVSIHDIFAETRRKHTVLRAEVDALFVNEKRKKPPQKPGGFENAFRTMFDRRATPPATKNGEEPKREEKREENKKEVVGDKETPATKKTPPTPLEIPEDVLRRMLSVASLFLFFFLPLSVFSVSITEVMYDLPGTDSGREWIEVRNTGGEPVDLSGWKFFEGNTNHTLTIVSGGAVPPGGYAVIADNATKFLSDWPNYSGVLYDSAFSLSNTGEYLSMKNPDGEEMSGFSYEVSLGASGDGNTLQLVGGGWSALPATPGSAPTDTSPPSTEDEGGGGGATEALSSPPPPFIEPQMFVDAGPDRTVFVGADSPFRARVLGSEGDPIQGARVAWSFGDGGRKEGEAVFYHFLYPGRYVVVVDATNGIVSASDRITVNAIPALITVSEVTDSYLTLRNETSVDVDIGGWMLFSSGGQFRFPPNTILPSKYETRFSHKRTGLSGMNPETIALQYPNGMVATVFEHPLILSSKKISVPAVSQEKRAPLISSPDNLPLISDEEEERVVFSQLAGVTDPLPEREGEGEFQWIVWAIVALFVGIGGAVSAIVFARKDTYSVEEIV